MSKKWDDCSVEAKANILAYELIREQEESDKLKELSKCGFIPL